MVSLTLLSRRRRSGAAFALVFLYVIMGTVGIPYTSGQMASVIVRCLRLVSLLLVESTAIADGRVVVLVLPSCLRQIRILTRTSLYGTGCRCGHVTVS